MNRIRATLKLVNRAVAKAGIPLELVRGEGYHYWVYDTASRWETVSEYLPYTNSVSVDCWLELARQAMAEITAKK
jgi:hypothetical protein